MKKFLTIVFIIFILFSINKISALPNPWTDCNDDISLGADVSGFNFPLRIENYSVRAMKDMMEIKFSLGKFFKKQIIVRKSATCQGNPDANGICDISGVYETYPINKTIMVKKAVHFNVRGLKRKFYVANFAAESGYYSFYSKKGLNLKDITRLYEILAEAEAPRRNYTEIESYSIEQLMDLRRVDDIVEPVFSQDCFPMTLKKKGVTQECFERANLGEDSVCSESEILMIKEYYKKGQQNDPLNNGSGKFCAD